MSRVVEVVEPDAERRPRHLRSHLCLIETTNLASIHFCVILLAVLRNAHVTSICLWISSNKVMASKY